MHQISELLIYKYTNAPNYWCTNVQMQNCIVYQTPLSSQARAGRAMGRMAKYELFDKLSWGKMSIVASTLRSGVIPEGVYRGHPRGSTGQTYAVMHPYPLSTQSCIINWQSCHSTLHQVLWMVRIGTVHWDSKLQCPMYNVHCPMYNCTYRTGSKKQAS